jgi:hypothetical protein
MGEEDIKGMFGAHGGVVSVTIVKDQLNRSKGFGFVEVRFSFSLPPSLPPCCASFLSPQGKSILFMSTTHTHTHLSFHPLSLLLFILSLTHTPTVKEEGELAIAALDGREIDTHTHLSLRFPLTHTFRWRSRKKASWPFLPWTGGRSTGVLLMCVWAPARFSLVCARSAL